VLVLARDQSAAAVALIELDGIARRLVVRPPAVSHVHLPTIAAAADVDAVVLDDDSLAQGPWAPALRVRCGLAITPAPPEPPMCATEWVLLTSGTTGVPKMLVHTLATLTAPLHRHPAEPDVVWSTFYDVRSYGGLQILLRSYFRVRRKPWRSFCVGSGRSQ
jgi:acyl-coenzyme A synthetase/AMP-(fatty) acid ligase